MNIDRSWAALSTNTTAISPVFLTTCDTTARLLVGAKTAVTKLKKESLGPAVARLNEAATGLKAVAQGVGQAGIFVDSLTKG